jgi:hypothetical protein
VDSKGVSCARVRARVWGCTGRGVLALAGREDQSSWGIGTASAVCRPPLGKGGGPGLSGPPVLSGSYELARVLVRHGGRIDGHGLGRFGVGPRLPGLVMLLDSSGWLVMKASATRTCRA